MQKASTEFELWRTIYQK